MKYVLLIVAFSGIITTTKAQGVDFVASYPIGFPLGKTSDYVEKTSFRGISFEINRVQNQKVEVGLELGWSLFYQEEAEKVYTQQTASIKGKQFRYVNAFPILAQVKTTFGDHKTGGFAPYGGLGIGTIYVNQSTDFGLYRITNEAWQFCLRPEVGMRYLTNNGVGGFVGLKYYAGFNASDLDGQSWLALNVGFIFSSR